MKHWEDEEAKKMLQNLTQFKPLQEVGTRIIIVDPVDTVVEEIRTGAFMAAIEETWFRLIGKQKAQINLIVYGQKARAKLPFPFPIPDDDTDDVKVWPRENDEIITGGVHYRIKHLQIGRRTDCRVPEDLRGVAVIHKGMKICSIPMLWVEPTIKDSVFGYVEFDRELDIELRKACNQVPNHYDLHWRSSIPRGIKGYVEEHLQKFGQAKLGIGIDWRQRREQLRTTAEQWALRQLSTLTPDFDLLAGHKGTRYPPPPPLPPPPSKEIGLTFHSIKFPDPRRAPLVHWDELITGFSVEAFNNKQTAYTCRIGVHVFRGNRQIIRLLNHRGVALNPGQPITFGPFEIQFLRQKFPSPDVYILRAILINEANGERLDELNRYIYVEKDPPFRAPFDVQMVSEFPIPYDKRQWRIVQTSDDRATLYYNSSHSAYRYHESNEGTLRLYLFEIFLEGALQLVLDRPIKENTEPDYHPLDRAKIEGPPKECYLEIIGKLGEVRQKLFTELG